MSNWAVQFDASHKIMDYFDQCEIKQKQNDIVNELIKKYTNPIYAPIEIGVGCSKYGENWSVLDPFDTRPIIDYRIGLEQVKDSPGLMGKFDFVKANAIFEHVQNPFECAEGIYLLLKEGGECLIDFPFAFPYHPFKGYDEETHGLLCDKNMPKSFSGDEEHGGDFWRYTPDSIRLIFKKLKMISLEKTNAGSFIYRGIK